MQYFSYESGQLRAENIYLAQLANTYGTPTYIYSLAALKNNYNAWRTAVATDDLICYAVKANPNIAILNVMAQMNSGFDIVSGGELQRVLRAGGLANKIIFSGVGKTENEIKQALAAGILCFNVESMAELEKIHQIARQQDQIAPISIRVNPNINAETHPYISTGLEDNKFGVDCTVALSLYQRANELSHLQIKGIACHIGSQLVSTAPLLEALDSILQLVDSLKNEGIILQYINLGGGLGVCYRSETPPQISHYIQQIKSRMCSYKQQLIFEPGRSIVANAGILITRVEYLKCNQKHNFAIVDVAMNDLLRPALYQAWHKISSVTSMETSKLQSWDIVGPICESADFLGKDRQLALTENSLLCIHDVGAYGFSMSSNYNSRPRVAEVMVDDRQSWMIRERETISDLYRHEHLLPLPIDSKS